MVTKAVSPNVFSPFTVEEKHLVVVYGTVCQGFSGFCEGNGVLLLLLVEPLPLLLAVVDDHVGHGQSGNNASKTRNLTEWDNEEEGEMVVERKGCRCR